MWVLTVHPHSGECGYGCENCYRWPSQDHPGGSVEDVLHTSRPTIVSICSIQGQQVWPEHILVCGNFGKPSCPQRPGPPGIIETRGLVALVEASDAMLK